MKVRLPVCKVAIGNGGWTARIEVGRHGDVIQIEVLFDVIEDLLVFRGHVFDVLGQLADVKKRGLFLLVVGQLRVVGKRLLEGIVGLEIIGKSIFLVAGFATLGLRQKAFVLQKGIQIQELLFEVFWIMDLHRKEGLIIRVGHAFAGKIGADGRIAVGAIDDLLLVEAILFHEGVEVFDGHDAAGIGVGVDGVIEEVFPRLLDEFVVGIVQRLQNLIEERTLFIEAPRVFLDGIDDALHRVIHFADFRVGVVVEFLKLLGVFFEFFVERIKNLFKIHIREFDVAIGFEIGDMNHFAVWEKVRVFGKEGLIGLFAAEPLRRRIPQAPEKAVDMVGLLGHRQGVFEFEGFFVVGVKNFFVVFDLLDHFG